VAALGQPQGLPLRRTAKARFFHAFGAFPQVRRQSRFEVLPFEDSDAILFDSLLTNAAL
jgi:hypothetical protein